MHLHFTGAISVSGMKTITIRNLALAQRSVQLVIRLIPYVKKHFEGCLRKTEGTQAESKQIETFRKQFDQVSRHFLNFDIYRDIRAYILDLIHKVLKRELTRVKKCPLPKHAFLGWDMHWDQCLLVPFGA